MAETDPNLVDFELDIGWALASGVDPADLLDRYRSRIGQLHVKDYLPVTQGWRSAPVDFGAGRVDWPRMLAAIARSKVEHIYVEAEEPFVRPPMDVARIAYDFLSRRLQ